MIILNGVALHTHWNPVWDYLYCACEPCLCDVFLVIFQQAENMAGEKQNKAFKHMMNTH